MSNILTWREKSATLRTCPRERRPRSATTSTASWSSSGRPCRRMSGPPHRMTPSGLAEWAELSSGAMTNRLDRLEKAGLVRRLPDPDDRRGVLVELTPEGVASIDAAVAEQAAKEI